MTGAAPLLEVEALSVAYGGGTSTVHALETVSFAVGRGENVGIVGESGCGKTTLIKALLRLLPKAGRVTGGRIRFLDHDLLDLPPAEMRRIRWRNMSFITQAAMNALNPVLSVERQIVEAILTHRPEVGTRAARESAQSLFELVGLNPSRLADYPHQFSGGMKQRAVIAMALALDPELIIADEPTTALDVVVQAQILKRLLELQQDARRSLVLVTHDMSVVAQTCSRVLVMYGGRLVEDGAVQDIFHAPYHPYTMGLRNAFPSVTGPKQPLISIPGSPPSLRERIEGCVFVARCPFAIERCRDTPPPVHRPRAGHVVACHRADIVAEMRERAAERATWRQTAAALASAGAQRAAVR